MSDNVKLGADQLLPYERAGESEPAHDDMSLFEELGSDHPAFADAEEPSPDRPASEDEPDEEEPEDDEESEDEESDDTPGDDEEDEEERDEEPDQTFTVKVDGEELEVNLEELLQGYSRTQDYTRKTQALSAKEQSELEALRGARQQYGTLLEKLESVLTDEIPAEPDWERIRVEDPNGYAAKYADYQRDVARVRAVQAERQRVADEAYHDEIARWNTHLAQEKAKLFDAVPEWKKDPAVAAKDLGELAKYAQTTYGYTQDDLGNIGDHRLMMIFRKAMLYDKQHTKGEDAIREKVKKAKVLTPGSKRAETKQGKKPGRKKMAQRAMADLEKSGRVEDAARVFENLFDD